MKDDQALTFRGEIIKALGNHFFMVRFEVKPGIERQMLCYTAGKLRKHNKLVKVLPGDGVDIKVPYGSRIGRIIHVYKVYF